MDNKRNPAGLRGDGGARECDRAGGAIVLRDSQPEAQTQVATLKASVVEKMRRWQRRLVADAIDIGADLLQIKQALDHGEFHKWIDAEFGEVRTAQRLMQVASAFAGKRDTVSCLNLSTVYALASPSTPQQIVEAVTTKIERGEPVNEQAIKQNIRLQRRQTRHRLRRSSQRKSRSRRQQLAEQQQQEADERQKKATAVAEALIIDCGVDVVRRVLDAADDIEVLVALRKILAERAP